MPSPSNTKYTSTARAGRSVLDYQTTDEIRQALSELNLQECSASPPSAQGKQKQLWDQEVQRLEVLLEYGILNTDQHEASFDKLTTEAGEHFNVPWAVISFVDMGRVWFKSWHKRDFDTSEIRRNGFFCSHAIQQQQRRKNEKGSTEVDSTEVDSFVVLDTAQDSRFSSSSATSSLNEQGQRFYAGVPLVVPEGGGVPIGTFCIMDSNPRQGPNGLSQQELQDLKKFAARTVQLLVDRKKEFLNNEAAASNIIISYQRAARTAANKSPLSPPSLHNNGAMSPRMPSIKHAFKQDSSICTKKTCTGFSTPGDATSTSLPISADANSTTSLSTAAQEIISRPMANVLLPDPNTNGVDPDTYLSQLVEATYGIKLKLKTGLELGDYFTPINDEQMGAYTMDVVSLARNNDTVGLRKVLQEQGREALDCFNRFGEGLLSLTCRRGFTSTVKFLLSKEEDGGVGLNPRVRDDFGRTPMHDCCWNPNPCLEICHALMERDPSLFFITDKRGYTPFQYARSTDWQQWRQFLLQRRHLLAPLTSQEIKNRFS